MGKFRMMIFIYVGVAAMFFVACQPTTRAFMCEDPLGCVIVKPEEPIKLGAIQTLNGGASNIGISQLNSIELAIAQRDGELFGHPILLQKEDELCSAEGGANAALKVVSDPKVLAVIGTSCSGAAEIAGPIISEAGLVMISGSNSAPSLTAVDGEKGEHWQAGYFRTRPNDSALMEAAARFVYDTLQARKVATIHDGDTYTQGVTEIFERAFKDLGGEVVLSGSISKGDTNFAPVLTAVSSTDADLVFFPLFSPEGDLLVQQAGDIDGLAEIPFLGTANSLNLDSFVDTAGSNALGTYFISTAVPEGSENEAFLQAYEAQFNELPHHQAYPYAYDATNLLLNAIEKIGIKDENGNLNIPRGALRTALYDTEKFDGLSGMISCDQFGDCSRADFHFLRFEDIESGAEGIIENIIYSYNSDTGIIEQK